MRFIISFIIGYSSALTGEFVFHLIAKLFSDTPFVRLIKLLAGVFVGITYYLVCSYWWFSEWARVSLGVVLLATFAPIGVVLIRWVINYMYKNN